MNLSNCLYLNTYTYWVLRPSNILRPTKEVVVSRKVSFYQDFLIYNIDIGLHGILTWDIGVGGGYVRTHILHWYRFVVFNISKEFLIYRYLNIIQELILFKYNEAS
jgi:hypothetical protein